MAKKRIAKDSPHYVDNKVFTQELHEYSKACRKAEADGIDKPVMSNYLGDCVIRMANRLSTSSRFVGYSYRDEMVANGILGAMKYMHKFDGTRYNNGFAYVTQILFSHMVLTIKQEKRHYETSLKLIQETEINFFDEEGCENLAAEHSKSIADEKLKQLEEQKSSSGQKSFVLKSGFTKEERSKAKGTPMDEYKK